MYYILKIFEVIMVGLSIRISEELNNTLNKSAEYLDKSKCYLVREALETYLQELQEDIEDYNDAKRIVAQNNLTYSLEEVMKELGFEDWKEQND